MGSPPALAPSTGVLPPRPSARPRGEVDRRRAVAIVVVAGVVLAGVLGAIVFLGSSSATPPPTFDEARGDVNRTVANLSGGGWSLLAAFGLDERDGSTISVPLVASYSGSDCSAVAVGGNPVPTSLRVPAYAGSFAAGRAPFWVFLLRQSAAGPFLLADVAGGSATPIGTLSGTGCLTNLSKLSVLPTRFVNSPTVAGKAWSGSLEVNASAFLAGDPAIDTLILLATGSFVIDSFTFTGWGLEYAPCGPFLAGTLTNETTYVAAFTPSGTLAAPAAESTIGCPTAAG